MIALETQESMQRSAAENLRNLRTRVASFWRPITRQPIDEWITSKLRLGRGDDVLLESREGRFTFHDRPWWRYPLECIATPECNSVSIPGSTQIAKTMLIIEHMLWCAEFAPGPGMLVVPDEGEAKKLRNRIYNIVNESKKFSKFERISVPPKHKWNLQEIDLGSMIVHIAWAGGSQRTRGKPCWYVWCTEVDVYPPPDKKAGDPIEAAKQRTKDVFRYTIMMESSPSKAPSRIYEEEENADVRWRWYVECPHCQCKQEARFFQYKRGPFANRGGIELTVKAKGGDGAQLMSPREAFKHAYYVCLNGCKIFNRDKHKLIESGQWYPKGWKHSDGEPDRRPARRVGFHLWAIHSPNENFGTLAEEYCIALKNGRKVDFYTNRLAIAYEEETRIPNWQQLGRRAAYTHSRRTVPDQCWFLSGGIDVQAEDNGARYSIRGWAPGRTSWLIDWAWVERDPSDAGQVIRSDLIECKRRMLDASFPVVGKDNQPSKNPLGQSSLTVRLANIDSNHAPMKVHNWLRSLPPDMVDRVQGDRIIPGRVRAIRGDHHVSPDVRYRHSLVESNSKTGERYEGGLHQWGICVYPYYTELTDMISGEPGGPGSWYVTADCLAHGKVYLQQVTNFVYVVLYDEEKGKIGKWRPKSGRIPVDFWDTETYSMAAAEMIIGSMGWEQAAWEAWRQKHLRQQERAPKTVMVDHSVDLGAR